MPVWVGEFALGSGRLLHWLSLLWRFKLEGHRRLRPWPMILSWRESILEWMQRLSQFHRKKIDRIAYIHQRKMYVTHVLMVSSDARHPAFFLCTAPRPTQLFLDGASARPTSRSRIWVSRYSESRPSFTFNQWKEKCWLFFLYAILAPQQLSIGPRARREITIGGLLKKAICYASTFMHERTPLLGGDEWNRYRYAEILTTVASRLAKGPLSFYRSPLPWIIRTFMWWWGEGPNYLTETAIAVHC